MRLLISALCALASVPAAGGFTDLAGVLGRSPSIDEIDRALVAGFEEAFGVPVVAGAPTPEEAERAAQLRCWKYDSAAWTYEGRIGERERRWGPPVS